MSIQAMKQALEALGTATYLIQYNAKIGVPAQAARWHKEYQEHYDECMNAITALRTAIEAAEKVEPVACLKRDCIEFRNGMNDELFKQSLTDRGLDVFTTPQPAIPAEWRHKLEHIIACAKLWDETGISRVKAITREAEAMLAAAPKEMK